MLAMNFILEYSFELGTSNMARKLHVEISPANWERIKEYIQRYNNDPQRVTPRYKPADVINLALVDYLRARRP
jgi:hypothetical protein